MNFHGVTKLRVHLLPNFLDIKQNNEFKEYMFPPPNHVAFKWNSQVYNSIRHSLLVALTNGTSIKSSMAPQAYEIFSTHAHENSGWIILSRLLNSRDPHLEGMNGDIQSDLATLAFRNGEQLEYFHIRILRLQQEIMLSG